MTQVAPRIRKPGASKVDRDVRAARVHQLMHQVKEQAAEADEQWSNGRKKYDWPAIKDFYLNYAGEITLDAVARQFGVTPGVLYQRSSTENWREERVYIQAKLLRERRSERTVDIARKAQDFDDRAYETAKLGLNLVTSRMAQIADQFTVQRIQFERALARAQAGENVTKADLWSSINYRELVELGKSLELFQHVGRRALGTDVQTIAMLMDSQDGAPLSDRQATIAEELERPDPDRLAALVDALVDANVMGLQFDSSGEVVGLTVLEGEVVSEEEPQLAIEGGKADPAT